MGAIGKRIGRLDARDKVLGKTQFGGDLAGPECLWTGVVRSQHPHAEILGIDRSAALKIPGVVAVYTAADVPGTNKHGLIWRDQEGLASKYVRYSGDAMSLVVAESREALEAGVAAVKVDYKPLPSCLSIDAAMAPDAPLLHPKGNIMGPQVIRKGDAEKAWAEDVEVWVEETFETQTVDHAFLDLEAGIAYMDGDVLTLHVSGQWVHEERRLVALALGMPMERIRIIQPATGGAFGGREDISIQIYLGLAAMLTGRPVRMQYTRAESTIARHKRHPVRTHYKLGAKKTGELVAAEVVVHVDKGAYASTGIAVMRKAASHITGPYHVPNVRTDVYGVHTNCNPNGAMRGFGAAQMAVAYEGMMDRLAVKLGMDKIELRRMNLIEQGGQVSTSQIIPTASAHDVLKAALDKFGWDKRDYTTPAPHLKRGYGLSVICFGLGYGDGFPDASRARVCFGADDVLEVYTGGVDVGQGLTTMVAQVAAEHFDVDPTTVRVTSADTKLTPEAGSSSATRQTFFTGSAVSLAASELKRQLMDIAELYLKIHPDEIMFKEGNILDAEEQTNLISLKELLAVARKRGYSLEGHGLFQPPTVPPDPHTGQTPRAFITYLFASHVAQVLVDTETGAIKVERIVACHDVGRAINPTQVEGQIQGGVVQGVGMTLMEEIIWRNGKIANPGFTDYILPTCKDIPIVEPVILEIPDPNGPFGAHGVGEPPLIGTPPAILSAFADATGVFLSRLPATPERVWRALQAERAAEKVEVRS